MKTLAWRAKADGLSGGLILVSVLCWLRLLTSLKTIFKLAPSRLTTFQPISFWSEGGILISYLIYVKLFLENQHIRGFKYGTNF